MLGVIRTRHLWMHAPLIIHEFGLRCFARCVWRNATQHRVVTFLECVSDQGPPPPHCEDHHAVSEQP